MSLTCFLLLFYMLGQTWWNPHDILQEEHDGLERLLLFIQSHQHSSRCCKILMSLLKMYFLEFVLALKYPPWSKIKCLIWKTILYSFILFKSVHGHIGKRGIIKYVDRKLWLLFLWKDYKSWFPVFGNWKYFLFKVLSLHTQFDLFLILSLCLSENTQTQNTCRFPAYRLDAGGEPQHCVLSREQPDWRIHWNY